jgi:hypothetical protein
MLIALFISILIIIVVATILVVIVIPVVCYLRTRSVPVVDG